MFGPLEFPYESKQSISNEVVNVLPNTGEIVICILCDKEYKCPNEKDSLLGHIFEEHKIVIADVHLISNLPKYIEYWKQRFAEAPITEFCTTILADIKKDGVPLKGNEYYLLSDVHEEDKKVRERLQNELLESALAQQKIEREDSSYSRGCLFCRQVIEPTRSEYIKHLSTHHNLQLGKPDNLVYIDKLIEMIEAKMENLQCIYCEKFFKDRNVLKEHMRKKLHKRINPDNEVYDQFYIINYKGPDKVWKSERKRKDSAEDEPCDWSDWQETLTVSIVCLICEETFPSWESVVSHMKNEHNFDYESNTADMDFYEQVKLVNYIRRQLYKNLCVNCGVQLTSRKEVLEHMVSENHLYLPPKDLWNQPEYYFPTYENDAFLCQIDDVRDNNELDSDLSDALSEINSLTGQDP